MGSSTSGAAYIAVAQIEAERMTQRRTPDESQRGTSRPRSDRDVGVDLRHVEQFVGRRDGAS
jgi:hypothetical protein